MYFSSLQILRGFAAIAVMLYHVQCYLPVVAGGTITGAGGTPTIFRFISGQFSMGASFFFVLSGFLMAYLIDIEYKKFLLRRLIRIYPAFILAVFVQVCIKGIFEKAAVPSDLWQTMSLLPLNTLVHRIPSPLGIEWTLIYEIFFYFVCAIFTLKVLRSWFPAFLVLWAAVIILAYQINIVAVNLQIENGTLLVPSWQWIFLSPKNLLFIGGGVGYYFLLKFMPKTNWVFLLVCVLISIITFKYSFRMGPHTLYGTIVMAVSFVVLIVGVANREKNSTQQTLSKNPVVRLFEKLGDYSYALYLVHVTVIVGIIKLTNFLWAAKGPSLLLQGILALTASLICGWYYGKIDVWIHWYFRKRFSGSKCVVAKMPD